MTLQYSQYNSVQHSWREVVIFYLYTTWIQTNTVEARYILQLFRTKGDYTVRKWHISLLRTIVYLCAIKQWWQPWPSLTGLSVQSQSVPVDKSHTHTHTHSCVLLTACVFCLLCSRRERHIQRLFPSSGQRDVGLACQRGHPEHVCRQVCGHVHWEGEAVLQPTQGVSVGVAVHRTAV